MNCHHISLFYVGISEKLVSMEDFFLCYFLHFLFHFISEKLVSMEGKYTESQSTETWTISEKLVSMEVQPAAAHFRSYR